MLHALRLKVSTCSLLILPVTVVVLVALQNNTLEYLAGDGYSSSVILLGRGVTQLLLSCFVGRSLGHSLLPTNWRTQTLRMANSGIGIYLSIVSFKFLSATTVSILQRLDIPFIIILTQFFHKESSSRRTWLSTIVIILVIFFAVFSRQVNEHILGFAIGLMSIFMLSVGFILVKRSVAHENTFVLVNVSSISCIIVGFVASFFTDQRGVHFHLEDYGLMIGAGAIQFALNMSVVHLYKQLPAERAQFPALLGALSTMLLEMLLKNEVFNSFHIAGILSITALVAYIAYNRTSLPQQVRSQNI